MKKFFYLILACICIAMTGTSCQKNGTGDGPEPEPTYSPILSFGFYIEDNTNRGSLVDHDGDPNTDKIDIPDDDITDFDKDYVVNNPETNIVFEIPAAVGKAALNARFSLLDNVILTVENGYEEVVTEPEAPSTYEINIDTLVCGNFIFDYSAPVDVTATDTITGQRRIYSVTVGNLPQSMQFSKVAEFSEPDFSSTNEMAMAVSPTTGEPYLFYQRSFTEADATVYKGSVVKWNGTAFGAVGSKDFTAGRVRFPAIQFIADGTPYVGYLDGSTSPANKPTIMNYTGDSWSAVGGAGFAEAGATTGGMDFLVYGTDNKIIEAHQQNAAGGQPKRQLNLSYYSGGTWNANNTISLIPGLEGTKNATYQPCFLASGNDVYAAITVNGVGYRTFKYDGTWTSLGNEPILGPSVAINDLDFVMDNVGDLYVVGIEANTTPDIMVMKYSKTSGEWNALGGSIKRNSTNGDCFSLAFDKANNPYVLYVDYSATKTYTINLVSIDAQTKRWGGPTVLESNASDANVQLAVNKDDVMYATFVKNVPKDILTDAPSHYVYNLYKIEK